MVELFAVALCSRNRRGCHAPVASVARLQAPHAGHVERTCRAFHPIRPPEAALVRTPWTGFALAKPRAHLLCIITTSLRELVRPLAVVEHSRARHFRVAPSPNDGQAHRIERRDYSSLEREGLDRRASFAPDEHVSMHPALPVQHRARLVRPRPLDPLVRRALPGVLVGQWSRQLSV